MRKVRRATGTLLAVAMALGIGSAALGQQVTVGEGVLVGVDLQAGLLTMQSGEQVQVDTRTEIVDGYGERLRLEQVPVSSPDESDEVEVQWEARGGTPPLATRVEVLLERPE